MLQQHFTWPMYLLYSNKTICRMLLCKTVWILFDSSFHAFTLFICHIYCLVYFCYYHYYSWLPFYQSVFFGRHSLARCPRKPLKTAGFLGSVSVFRTLTLMFGYPVCKNCKYSFEFLLGDHWWPLINQGKPAKWPVETVVHVWLNFSDFLVNISYLKNEF